MKANLHWAAFQRPEREHIIALNLNPDSNLRFLAVGNKDRRFERWLQVASCLTITGCVGSTILQSERERRRRTLARPFHFQKP